MHFKLGEKRLPFIIVFQRDGYAVLVIGRADFHSSKARAYQSTQSGSRLPGQLMNHRASDVEVLDVERVFFDEFAALLDVFAH